MNVYNNIVVFNKKELENNWHRENEDAFIALKIFTNVRNNVVVLLTMIKNGKSCDYYILFNWDCACTTLFVIVF